MTQYLTLEDVLFLIDDLGVGPVRDIGLLDWKAYERAVETGYQYAVRVIGGQRDRLYEQVPLRV